MERSHLHELERLQRGGTTSLSGTRRLAVLLRHLEDGPARTKAAAAAAALARVEVVALREGLVVRIGDAETRVKRPSDHLLVPHGYYDGAGSSQEALRVLQFLMKKESLRQDVFLDRKSVCRERVCVPV